nr:MAG TPA: hypothetical protein [Caudoviricetes sp.]
MYTIDPVIYTTNKNTPFYIYFLLGLWCILIV